MKCFPICWTANFQDKLEQCYEQYASWGGPSATLSSSRPTLHGVTFILPNPERLVKSQELSTVSIVGEEVDGAARHTGDDTRGTQGLDAGGDRSRGGQTLESLEVENQAGDVRRSHRGAGDAVAGGVGTNPGGGDAAAGSENVHTASEVRVGGPAVRVGGGTDGDGVGCRGG